MSEARDLVFFYNGVEMPDENVEKCPSRFPSPSKKEVRCAAAGKGWWEFVKQTRRPPQEIRSIALSLAMSLTLAEILALRQDKFSSVAALIGALDRLSASNEHLEMWVYAVTECADLVLLNVAVHAMEALSELPIQASRRAAQPSRRRRPRHVPGQHQGQITMFVTA